MIDAEAFYQTLLHQLMTACAHEARPVHLIGIHSGGAWIAQRLHDDLSQQADIAHLLTDAPGFLDISFYRDDFERIGLHTQVKPSDIPFDVTDKHLTVVDDVLYTGRTMRAAMNELFDYGRPASIRLAALIDRGGRELPIAADFIGGTTLLPPAESLVLSQRTDGGLHLHIEPCDA